MADDSMALLDTLRKATAGGADRRASQVVRQWPVRIDEPAWMV
jgi:hypothetical protein